ARGLAAVKIDRVRGPVQLGDAVPVLLAVGFARVLGLQAVEPAALIFSVEHAPPYQCLDPDGEIVGGGNDTPRRRCTGMVQVGIVGGQKGAGARRSLDLGRVRRCTHQGDRGAAVQVAVRVWSGDGVHGA